LDRLEVQALRWGDQGEFEGFSVGQSVFLQPDYSLARPGLTGRTIKLKPTLVVLANPIAGGFSHRQILSSPDVEHRGWR
jgi:hypothetical protein